MARRAVQSAVAAPATYLLMRGLDLNESFLAILSAVLIIQPSVGGTMGAAFTRVQATFAGSLISLACLALLPDVWGTTVALALSMLVVGGVAGARPDWTYGAVAAVGIAMAPDSAMLETSAARGVAIALGAATGVLVALVVWPDRAEARFDRHFRRALRATATRLGDALKAATQDGQEPALPDHVSEYYKAVQEAQEALSAAKLVDRAGMNRRLEALRMLYNSVIILDRATEDDRAPSASDNDLKAQSDTLRQDACAVLRALADGEGGLDPRIDRMDSILAHLQACLAGDKAAPETHQTRNVFAFGLHEVRRTLATLIDACQSAD
nr:FUSC family protein [Paracoccus saliphilus]